MSDMVEVRRVAALPIAVVRRRASPQELAVVVPAACGEVWESLRETGIEGAGRHVAVYLDGQIQLEVGAEVPPSFRGNDRVVRSDTPAGPAATATHFGPYHLLHEAHAAIHEWCAEHRRRLAGPSWEIYGHWDDDPSRLRTDVFYLLEEEDGSAAS